MEPSLCPALGSAFRGEFTWDILSIYALPSTYGLSLSKINESIFKKKIGGIRDKIIEPLSISYL